MQQEMTGWQWHQLQIICTSLQTDNHVSTSSLDFLQAGCFPDAQLIVSKHWRKNGVTTTDLLLLVLLIKHFNQYIAHFLWHHALHHVCQFMSSTAGWLSSIKSHWPKQSGLLVWFIPQKPRS